MALSFSELSVTRLDLTVDELADMIREAVCDCNDVDGVDWKTAAKQVAEAANLDLTEAL